MIDSNETEESPMLNRYIGDRTFYRQVLAIALPIILQNAITNFVSMLDNVMVGQLSTAEISGVTIANNNLLFIFNLCLFGGAAGAGIFTTQCYGSRDHEGIRYTFRYKLLICLLLTLIGAVVFIFGSDWLISLYLQGEGDPALAADTLYFGRKYLMVMLFGLLPFALTNVYASTLRECSQPTIPMLASLAATATNLVLNYVLIFGHFGCPTMGVTGAALATVISRYVELAVVVLWTHCHGEQHPFIKGVYRSFYIPGKLFRSITLKGTPLLVNEGIWSLGMAFLNQCYSYCGLAVVPALSISTTIYNLSGVVFRSLGNTVGIIIGQMLGAHRPEGEVRASYRKMTAMSVMSGVLFGALSVAVSGLFPRLYNTGEQVRILAAQLIVISSVLMPLQAYIFPVYFTLRAGGKTMITFLFDSGAVWVMSIPLAFVLSRYTGLSILVIYTLCTATDAVKCVIGAYMIRKVRWVQTLAEK